MSKRVRKIATGDFPVLMPDGKPHRRGPHPGWWIALGVLAVALIGWLVIRALLL